MIDIGRQVQLYRSDRADIVSEPFTNAFARCHSQRTCNAIETFCLEHVEFVITAQYQRDEIVIFGLDNQRFQALLRGDAKAFGERLDGCHTRGINGFHGFARGCSSRFRRQRGHGFDVGGKVGLIGEGDRILAGIREYVKLLRSTATDGSGIGADGAIIQAEAIENADVGLVHDIVGLLHAVWIQVKGIGVFHNEFA